jgi:uncharacterized protein
VKTLDEPLSDAELDWLQEFLLERIDDDAETEGKDEGVLAISELDGLLTAIVSAPVTILPSRWLPAVWGDFAPVWDDIADAEHVLGLMMRHMNGIAGVLMRDPEDFEPMFEERSVDGKTYTIVDEWCEGYMRGVGLAAEEWRAAGEDMTRMLAPILAFTSLTDWLAHEKYSEAETDRVRDAIAPAVREIHAWWLARRSEAAHVPEPVRRKGPRIGRNDPCPCGSGKKYKKCCLH